MMIETSSLIFKVKKNYKDERWEIIVSLSDECGNGHEDFSITGSVYEKNAKEPYRFGAMGKSIIEIWPEFEIFSRLHLSDFEGSPMYAVENGWYHMGNKKVAMRYLRITEEEYDKLLTAKSKEVLSYLIVDLGINKRWKEEAKEATAILEQYVSIMSGVRTKFVSQATKRHFNPS